MLIVLDCEVLTIEPHTTLSYRWDFANENPALALKRRSPSTLTPTAKGTLLARGTGRFPAGPEKKVYGGARFGWHNTSPTWKRCRCGKIELLGGAMGAGGFDIRRSSFTDLQRFSGCQIHNRLLP